MSRQDQIAEIRKKTIVTTNGCWAWTGYLDRRGYSRFTYDGKRRFVHRVIYELTYGPFPELLTIDHICFTPACVNPEHLRLLSHEANVQNQRSAHKTHCSMGHEYTPENTYIRPRKHRGGVRDCRACIRERVRKYASKKRGNAA